MSLSTKPAFIVEQVLDPFRKGCLVLGRRSQVDARLMKESSNSSIYPGRNSGGTRLIKATFSCSGKKRLGATSHFAIRGTRSAWGRYLIFFMKTVDCGSS